MDYRKLVASLIITQLAGIIGAFFTSPSVGSWYIGLNKPFFTPPSWVFAPAWTILFLLMGISVYLIWEKGWRKNINALIIFDTQLVLNVVWSILFFGLQNPLYALIEIFVLWIAILVTILKFRKISEKAGLLLVPYILWVSFAVVLNLFIVLLN